MLQSGDEYGHTAKGNNNRWSLDTDANHFLWDELSNNSSLVDFVCNAIHFRKKHKEIFNQGFLTQDNITWLDATANPIQWSPGKFLAYELKHAHYSLFTAF
ncbi:putative glycosyl hydrolase, partial [Chlamydia psittaci 84-8471/1]